MPSKAKFLGALAAGGGLIVWGSLWGVADAPAQPLDAAWAREDVVSIVFGGDIMLDRNVAKWQGSEPEALFAGVAGVFKDADLRVANLEGAITTNPSLARQNSKILRFTFDPEFARAALAPLRLDAVSLANNHTYDFYRAGYESTRAYLAQWGIASFGHPYDAAGHISTVLESRGKTVCLVGYHSLYDADTKNVVAEIERLRPECWRAVVFAHWGEEYQAEPEPATRLLARSFVDAGADLVIGAHPHVVQPHEIYKGRVIFYSLGNFMFDQQFSPEVMQGLVVRAELGEKKACYTPIPVAIEQAAVTALAPLDTFCLPW